jgi:hypothetical protein
MADHGGPPPPQEGPNDLGTEGLFYLTIGILILVWMLAGALMFYLSRGAHPIKGRYPRVVLFTNMILAIFVFLLCLQRLPTVHITCQLSLLAGHFFILVIFNLYLARCALLIFDFKRADDLSKGLNRDLWTARRPWRSLRRAGPALALWIFVLMIPSIIRSSQLPVVDQRDSSPTGCFREYADVLLVIYIIAYVIAFIMVALYLRFKVKEGFHLKGELSYAGAVCFVVAIVWVSIVREAWNNAGFSYSTLVLVFGCSWAYATSTFMPLYYANLFKSPSPTAAAASQEAKVLDIKSVLADPKGEAQFRKFLQLEFSAENLQFCLEVAAYKKEDFGVTNAAEVKRRATKIVADFVTQTSPYQVNLDYRLAETVIKDVSAMTASGGSLDPDVFNPASDAINALMVRDSFPRFLRHPLYEEYCKNSSKTSP